MPRALDSGTAGRKEEAEAVERETDGPIEEQILAAARIMANVLAESLLHQKAEHVSLPQFRVLDMVQNLTGKPSEIARMLGVSPPAVSFLLDKLEEKGLLRRVFSTKDRRRVELELTREGEELVRGVNAYRRRRLGRILAGMEEGERGRLLHSLRAFNQSYLALKQKEA